MFILVLEEFVLKEFTARELDGVQWTASIVISQAIQTNPPGYSVANLVSRTFEPGVIRQIKFIPNLKTEKLLRLHSNN